jgi:translation initiation factor 2B subunit (eIF-2B alpha/beta/delta family)
MIVNYKTINNIFIVIVNLHDANLQRANEAECSRRNLLEKLRESQTDRSQYEALETAKNILEQSSALIRTENDNLTRQVRTSDALLSSAQSKISSINAENQILQAVSVGSNSSDV